MKNASRSASTSPATDPRHTGGTLLLRRRKGRSQRRNLDPTALCLGETSCTGLHGANRLASNSLIEAVVYADQAAKHATSRLSSVEIQEGIPDWDFEGTQHTEEMLMIIQSKREMQAIMSNYVASSARISRSNAPCAACRSSTKRPKSYTTRSSPIASCANCAT